MQVTKRSLQRQILLWTVLPLLALWLAGAVVIYWVSFHFVNERNDAQLSRLATTISRQLEQNIQAGHPPTAAALAQSTASILAAVSNEPIRFVIEHQPLKIKIGKPFHSLPKTSASQLVFSLQQINGQPHRILSAYFPPRAGNPDDGLYLELITDLSAQTASLQRYLLHMALPLIVMLILVSVLIGVGIKNSLKPLRTLKQLVETRKAQDLSPLSLDNAPEELNALSKALNQLLSSTEESITRQRRFIADAAHQLRTPLAGLKSQTELAMRENSPEGLRDRLNMVHTSATRSIHLVNQLLTLARSEPGSINGIPKIKMDLARLIRDLTGELVPRALAARIDLGCDCLVQEAWIEGNSALLRELFINLVENAIKYIPRDASVTVRLTENETQYIVDVEDSGPGIPDADKQRVFERFFRREQTGNGCGLGMAIVKEIVERHHGSVELLDAKPHGLIVHVVLPKNPASI
ncbi:ATP-binding protein [Chitinibacter sp. S2-10]|uniref:sensor histidine kinase n=1 Tax=Chitinibacter sp. S2-10 TaxID=3373597 RepID=UPI003977D7CE